MCPFKHIMLHIQKKYKIFNVNVSTGMWILAVFIS